MIVFGPSGRGTGRYYRYWRRRKFPMSMPKGWRSPSSQRNVLSSSPSPHGGSEIRFAFSTTAPDRRAPSSARRCAATIPASAQSPPRLRARRCSARHGASAGARGPAQRPVTRKPGAAFGVAPWARALPPTSNGIVGTCFARPPAAAARCRSRVEGGCLIGPWRNHTSAHDRGEGTYRQ